MLAMCERDQWSLDDIDWTRPPKDLSREDEESIVQYFYDMSGIERLAKALFEVQIRLTDDPTLKMIFRTFIEDEERHALAAERLAAFFDVHHYQDYRVCKELEEFRPRFLDLMNYLTPVIANAYVTCGELILDIALIRSLNDYVDDPTCREVMELINRDESRHIAVDYHMTDYYSSDAYLEALKAGPKISKRRQVRGVLALGRMFYHARPFFKKVFFDPMDRVDPSRKRMKEAFKRIQLVTTRPGVKSKPFIRFMLALKWAVENPVLGRFARGAVVRITGADVYVLRTLYTEEEARWASVAPMEELAAEALSVKASA